MKPKNCQKYHFHLNFDKSIFLAIMVTYEIYKIQFNQCGESFTVIFDVYSAGLKYIKLINYVLTKYMAI